MLNASTCHLFDLIEKSIVSRRLATL